ncbi:hypothetical protein [Pyrobaculum neutrophilum]|uniref:Tetratricopeptide TPR_4 n=1 Tax=Pyrobaculum neutrophilum (strain DSM 2338 / JCM 9278 / NBRC 100436 / V24Sta) TaxID=444157 RepID=B1YDY4_PYRNV|nr:hypothetical protein [Pyrobaculum neutrophilum]ACB39997.1 Tetratricopeptide TPR_4 [Pyrobaculum neutrophilum V24Sta]
MECSYWPRPVDRAVLADLEQRRPGALLGPRRSGVSTTAKRLANIAGVEVGEGLKCGSYAVVEVSPAEVEKAVRCGAFAVATGPLAEVMEVAGRVGAYVMPPMSKAELLEFLATFGQATEPDAAEDLIYITGGYPEALCAALEKLNYPGKIAKEHVEELGLKPLWFLEAVESFGPDFLKGAVLGYLSEEELGQLGIRPGAWFERRGDTYVLRLPWLQFFAVKYDPELAKGLLEEALKIVKDPVRRLYYEALLWRLGVNKYLEDSAKYVDALFQAPPQVAADLAIYFLESRAGGRRGEAKAILALSEAMRYLEFTTADVVYLARRAAALAPAEEAYSALYNLGALLLGRGKYREAESVLSIVEDLLFKLEGEDWIRAKRVLHLLLAYREALLGNWREVKRLLEDEHAALRLERSFEDVVKLNLGWAYIMLGEFKAAREMLRRYRGFQTAALFFLTSKKAAAVREYARKAGADVIAALAGLAAGLDVRGELEKLDIRPELKTLLKLLAEGAEPKALASVASRIDPMDKLTLFYHAVEAYLLLRWGAARREEVLEFYERLKNAVGQAGIPGAARYMKPELPSLARLAVFFL